jgi:hypothetical protein
MRQVSGSDLGAALDAARRQDATPGRRAAFLPIAKGEQVRPMVRPSPVVG